MVVVRRQEGRRAKVAGTRVIADGNFRPSESVSLGPPIIGEEPRSWSEQILEKKRPYAGFSPNIWGQISGSGRMSVRT